MIYIDASVALASLLAEDRTPPPSLWAEEPLITSRLLEYEVWNRINGRGLGESHGDATRLMLASVSFVEFAAPVLARALEPFPTAVRTLDALHLATIEFLRGLGQRPALATYDLRMSAAAQALDIPLMAL